MIATAGRIAEQPDHWWVDQLNNHDAIGGYTALGEEIWLQTDGEVDAFVHAVGTAHSIHAAGAALRVHRPDLCIVAVEPAESAVLSGYPTGSHWIEGIGIGFLPPLWERDKVDEIEMVASVDAQATARRDRMSGPSCSATCSAATTFAPDEVPAKTPSSAARRRSSWTQGSAT